MKLWVDADPLIYQAAYVAEYNIWSVGDQHFKYKKEAEEYKIRTGLLEVELGKTPVLEDISLAISAMKNSIRGVIDQCVNVYPGISEYTLVISGVSNYRNKISANYKVGRVKPTYYAELRNKILNWGAIVQEQLEADDLIAVLHTKEYKKDKASSVIATIDKDLYILPGLHYDWRRKEAKDVTPEYAQRWFFRQLLHGDRTDTIKGIHRVGKETAKAFIDSLAGKYAEEKLEAIVGLWKDKEPLTYAYRLQENWKLLDIGGYYSPYLKKLKEILAYVA